MRSIFYTEFDSPLGRAICAESEKGIVHLSFGMNRTDALREIASRIADVDFVATANSKFGVERAVAAYASGDPRAIQRLPLDPAGTDFQLRAWEILRAIPFGETISYSDVARCLGKPSAVRAAASAVAANRIALAIPCHRVIRNDGSLGEFRWGREMKPRLLDHEKSSRRPRRAAQPEFAFAGRCIGSAA